MPKIVNFIHETPWSDDQLGRLKALGEFVDAPAGVLDPSQTMALLKDADYALVSPTSIPRLTRELLAASKNLRGVVVNTTTLGWVDTEAAKEHKIPVWNIPGYSTEAVVEFTIGLIFALVRQISFADREVKLRGEQSFERFLGFELRNSTLGVIGLGDIGHRVAEAALLLGMDVLAWNRSEKMATGITMVSKEELLAKSDIVSLHLAVTPETSNFLGRQDIAMMKDGAMLINVSREELIDQKAVLEAIKQGKLTGYAFEMNEDAWTTERRELSHLDNVIATPHIAWYTPESRVRANEMVVRKLELAVKKNSR